MITDKEKFENARYAAVSAHERFNIGTYKERSQHLILKLFYEPDTSMHEIKISGHIADIKNAEGIFEIQTSGFRNLKTKLSVFLKEYKVKIIYPCPIKKRICWVDPLTGDSHDGRYRNYPKKIYTVLPELLHISEYIGDPNLSVDIVLTEVSEVKLLDGYGADRKKRSTKKDTVPDSILDIITISDSSDIFKILPFEHGQTLTNEEFSKIFGYKGRNLWMAVQFLLQTGFIELDTKIGNKKIYKYIYGEL